MKRQVNFIRSVIYFGRSVTLIMIVAVVFFIIVPPGLILGQKRYSPWIGRHFSSRFSHFLNRFILRISLTVNGKESLPPPNQTYISISNHLSFMDINILFDALACSFIMKRGILYIPFFGGIAYIYGCISIKRFNLRDLKSVAEKMIRFARYGVHPHVFPEGTRSRTGETLEFKKGLLHKIYKEKIPVLCCAVWNTHTMFPAGLNFSSVNFSAPVSVSIGKLFNPEDFDAFDDFFRACFNEVEENLAIAKNINQT